MKWQSGDPKKELNLLAGRDPQSQANADRSDPVLRVNTILFSKTICSIRLVQAEGQGGRRPPSAAPLLSPSPCLLICSLTASFNRMTPDTELSVGRSHRLSGLPGRPSERGAGVLAERRFVRGQTGCRDLCCGFSAHKQTKKRVLCFPVPFLSFLVLSFFLLKRCFPSLSSCGPHFPLLSYFCVHGFFLSLSLCPLLLFFIKLRSRGTGR